MKEPKELIVEVLSATDEIKARTLDSVIRHLEKVILSEPRERERKRARIAIINIAKWVKINEEIKHEGNVIVNSVQVN